MSGDIGDKHKVMIASWAAAILFVTDDLNAILEAVDDPNLDSEQTLETVKRRANDALERFRLAGSAIAAVADGSGSALGPASRGKSEATRVAASTAGGREGAAARGKRSGSRG
jgi:hypothetical protein